MAFWKTIVTGTAVAAISAGAAFAETVIRVQSVIPAKADEVHMLNDFAADVAALTGGSLKIEVLPAGAVVGVKETLDAVDSGLIEGGFAWTHYWSGKHPAAMLFGSPVAGAGVGIDNIAFVSWFLYGGGQPLYDRAVERNGRQRQRLHAAAGRPGSTRLVQRADQVDGLTSASIVSARLLAFPARPTRTLVLHQWPWVAATSCRHWKRAQSTQLNGAARSLTACSVSRRS